MNAFFNYTKDPHRTSCLALARMHIAKEEALRRCLADYGVDPISHIENPLMVGRCEIQTFAGSTDHEELLLIDRRPVLKMWVEQSGHTIQFNTERLDK